MWRRRWEYSNEVWFIDADGWVRHKFTFLKQKDRHSWWWCHTGRPDDVLQKRGGGGAKEVVMTSERTWCELVPEKDKLIGKCAKVPKQNGNIQSLSPYVHCVSVASSGGWGGRGGCIDLRQRQSFHTSSGLSRCVTHLFMAQAPPPPTSLYHNILNNFSFSCKNKVDFFFFFFYFLPNGRRPGPATPTCVFPTYYQAMSPINNSHKWCHQSALRCDVTLCTVCEPCFCSRRGDGRGNPVDAVSQYWTERQ